MRLNNYPCYPDADRATVFEEALEFQDFVTDLILNEIGIAISNYSSKKYQTEVGENPQGVEIKLDTRILETKNVSIECFEKSKADNKLWIPSGILRKDNSWLYIQGNYEIVFVFSKAILRLIYENRYKDKLWEPKKTIKTFLLPVSKAKEYALIYFCIKNRTFVQKNGDILFKKSEDMNQILKEKENGIIDKHKQIGLW